jgi:hypothetical protein
MAQVRHGTIAVVHYTSDKIIIAVDSRAAYVGGGPGRKPQGSLCKLAAFNRKLLFVNTGITCFDTTSHSATCPVEQVKACGLNADTTVATVTTPSTSFGRANFTAR